MSSDDRVVQIEGQGFGGEGFARTESGQYISVPHTLPGDRVRVHVGEFRRGRAFAEVLEWLERSTDHVDPGCHHYAECSGCSLRHVSFSAERRFKLDAARQILRRYGPDGDWSSTLDWISTRTRVGHRSRGRFRVERHGDDVVIGLRGLSLDAGLVDIRDCPAQSRRFSELMTSLGCVFDDHPDWVPALSWIEIRTGESTGPALVVVAMIEDPPTEMVQTLRDWATSHDTAVGVVVRDEPLHMLEGAATVEVLLGGERRQARVDVPWRSWTHASPKAAQLMTTWVADWIADRAPRRLLDLCSGIGTLTIALAPLVDHVIAVDEDHLALAALRSAAEEAGLAHITARAGRVGTVLRKLRRELPPNERPDVVVVNPMRRPLGLRQLRDLQPLAPRYIVYAGPSPVSAARDCRVIAQLGYRAVRAAVADLHPATAQMMLIVCLEKREGS